MEMPDSMDECVYFTRRKTDKGSIIAWATKKECPECKKCLMGKPVEKGHKKIRAEEYVCPGCNYSEPKDEHEESLMLNVQYTCPLCSHKGEISIPYKRKKFEGVDSYIFICQGCQKKVPITKKMKALKKGKTEAVPDIE